MNKEEILNRLIQKSICINAGGEGYYSPYRDDTDWFSDIDNLILMYEKSQQENKQLKDNWNKLKNIAKSQSDFKLKCHNESLWFEVDELLNKMQELENGGNNG